MKFTWATHWVISICVIAIFAAISWMGRELRTENRLVAERFTQNLAASIDAQVFERYGDSQALALNSHLLSLVQNPSSENKVAASKMIREFIRLYLVYSKVVISDDQGHPLLVETESGDSLTPAVVLNKNYQAHFATEIETLNPNTQPQSQFKEFQIFRSPIRDASGSIRGWVENYASTLYLDRELKRTLGQSSWPETEKLQIMVRNDQGKLIAQVADNAIFYFGKDLNLSAIDSGNYELFEAATDDQRLANPLKWKVAVAIPSEILFESVQKIERILFIINAAIIISALISIALIRNQQQRESRRISELVLSAQENEKARISREIHDDVGQNLTAAKLWISRIKAGFSEEDSKVIQELRSLIDSTNDSLRSISMQLHPSLVENLGWESAIRWKLDNASMIVGFSASMENTSQFPFDVLTRSTQRHLFRIVQEAIQNVQKHAKACEVNVRVSDEGDKVIVRVVDDGEGIGKTKLGLGLHSMRERAQILGGDLKVISPLPPNLRSEYHVEPEFPGTCIQFEIMKDKLMKEGVKHV